MVKNKQFKNLIIVHIMIDDLIYDWDHYTKSNHCLEFY